MKRAWTIALGAMALGVLSSAGCGGDGAAEEPLGQAALPCTVSAPFEMDAPLQAPAPGNNNVHDVAFDGSTYYVVWQNGSSWLGEFEPRTYVTRVAPSGAVLDPWPIETPFPWARAAAGAGAALLVGVDPSAYGFRLGALTSAGTLLAGDKLPPFASTRGYDDFPALGFDGTSFAVAWAEKRTVNGQYYARFSRVSSAGALLDGAGIPLFGAPIHDLSFGGTSYLVVAKGVAARVSAQGVVLDPGGFDFEPKHFGVRRARARFDGANWIVAYSVEEQTTSGVDFLLYLKLVSQRGIVHPKGGVLVDVSPNGHFFTLATDGNGVHLFWSRGAGASGLRREDFDGKLRWLGSSQVAGPGVGPAGSFGGNNGLLAWSEGTSACPGNQIDCWSPTSAVFSRLDASLTLLDTPPLLASRAENAERAPSAAWDGQSFLVSWADSRGFANGGFWDVHATRVSPSGAVLDPSGITVESGGGASREPITTFDGQGAWVTAAECKPSPLLPSEFPCTVRARPVDAGGVPGSRIEPFGQSSYNDGYLGAAPGVDGFRILATDTPSGISARSAFVETSGTVASPIVGPIAPNASSRAIAFDGTNHFVIWSAGNALRGVRIDAQGTVLDATPISVATTTDTVYELNLVFDGTNFVALYTTPGGYLWAARVRPDGVALDPMGMVVLSFTPSCEGVGREQLGRRGAVFDGQRIVVALRVCYPQPDILGAAIAPNGALLETFPITNDPDLEGEASLAAGSHGKTLVVYTKYRSAPSHPTTYRVLGQVLEF